MHIYINIYLSDVTGKEEVTLFSHRPMQCSVWRIGKYSSNGWELWELGYYLGN